jgi:CheY-like chemotaxis protein
MSEMDGYEVAKIIHSLLRVNKDLKHSKLQNKIKARREVTIIAITAFSENNVREQAKAAGIK